MLRSALKAATIIMVFVALASCGATPTWYDVLEEELTYQSGSLEHSATLYLPDRDIPVPLLIVYHAASGGNVNFPFYEHLRTELPSRGIAVLLYNRRGSGGQPGNFDTASFEVLADDGIAAAIALSDDPRIDSGRIGAWGVSQGGWIAPVAANRSDLISYAISVSGPGVSPAEQMAFTSAHHLEEQGYDSDVVAIALMLRAAANSYFRGTSGQQETQKLIDQYRAQPWFSSVFLPNGGSMPSDVTQSKWNFEMDFDPTLTIGQMTDPFLVVFGANDRWVSVNQSVEAIRDAYPQPSMLSIYVSQTSGHLMSGQDEPSHYAGNRPVESEYIDRVADWIHRLPQP